MEAGERTELWGAAVTEYRCTASILTVTREGEEKTGWPGADGCGIYTRAPLARTLWSWPERAAAARAGLDWIVARRACRHVALAGSDTRRNRNSAPGGP